MKVRRQWLLATVPIVLFLAFNLFSQAFYTHQSLGLREGTSTAFIEIPGISRLDFDGSLKAIGKQVPPDVHLIVSDTGNLVLAKIIGDYFKNQTLAFPSTDFWGIGTFNREGTPSLDFLRDSGIEQIAAGLSNERHSHLRGARFSIPVTWRKTPLLNTFVAETFETDLPGPKMLLATNSNQSVFNLFTNQDYDQTFRLVPFENVHNYLIFVDSALGHSYAFGSDPETFFQLEADFFYPNRQMVGAGRYLLFRVENSSPAVRLILSLTTSLQGENRTALPPVTVVGKTRASMHAVGNGSGRLISDPVVPQTIDGGSYIFVDMGEKAQLFPRGNYGALFNLYRRNVLLDHRRLNGFLRDASAIDEKTYEGLSLPSQLHLESDGLTARNAFYSGIYEDGWISGDATVRLSGPATGDTLHVAGVVPLIDDSAFNTTIRVSIDGRTLSARDIGVGTFDIAQHVARPRDKHEIRISFSRTQRLPGGDSRPVGAKIARIGF